MSRRPKLSVLKDRRAKRDLAIFLVGFGALAVSVLLALQQILIVPFAVLLLFWVLGAFAVVDFCVHAWRNYVKPGFFSSEP